jgi:hypothetical protein
MEVSGQLHAPVTAPKEPLAPIGRRLRGPQRWSGHSGEKTNSQPLLGIEPLIIKPITQCYTKELSQHIIIYMLHIKWPIRSCAQFLTVNNIVPAINIMPLEQRTIELNNERIMQFQLQLADEI